MKRATTSRLESQAQTRPPIRGNSIASEVVARPQRRSFSADYKRRILQEADHCRQAGHLGALLRREGLYSSASYIARWFLDTGVSQKISPSDG